MDFKNAARTLGSKEFRRGFHDGFAAPMMFFTPNSKFNVGSASANIATSWKDVDNALKGSFLIEREKFVKSSKTARTGTKTAA
jgi:hypothetical protein